MKERIWLLDWLRGLAILLVVAFHVVFDLNHFYGWQYPRYDGLFWYLEGRIAAILFMGMVGVVSAIIARQQTAEKTLKVNIRRGIRLIGIALIITAFTWISFPESTIWFGILHLMGVSILLSIPLVRLKWINIALGILVISLGGTMEAITGTNLALLPLGITTSSFSSFDYYPLIPWMGVIIIGIGLGNIFYPKLLGRRAPNKMDRKMIILGKNSLWIYLLHQPVILLILWLILA